MTRSAAASRRSLGATLAPALLRLVLALTFIWAGLGKLMARMPVDEQQLSLLASMGVAVPQSPTAGGSASPQPSTPPPTGSAPADADAPGSTAPPGPTEPIPPPNSPRHSPVAPTPAERAVRPDGASSSNPTPPPATPSSPAAPASEAPPPAEPGAAQNTPSAEASKAPTPTVRRVWGLALRIHSAANPGVDDSGKPRMKLWPASLGSGNWPRYFALAVVIAELGGGVLVGLGLLTRLGAAALAGVMLGAMWLDQIGPAMQAGTTVLWLLPAHDAWDVAAWRPLLWQFALLCCAGAVVLLGAGAPSLDRALGWFGGRGDDDDL